MITDSSIDANQMLMKTDDVLMRLNSMLTYVKTINEHAVNTPCSEDKVKEPIINFLSKSIEDLQKKIEFVESARKRLVEE
jgi:hypothetical protein